MPLLHFIDIDGREQDVENIEALYDLIRAGRINYESLVRDDVAGRWVKAAEHNLFKRIREIAAQQQVSAPAQVYAAPEPRSDAVPTSKFRWKWLTAIKTRDEAIKAINETAAAFFVVAAIQTALGFVLMNANPNVGADALIDGPLYAGLAVWLRWGRSRIAAVLLLIIACISATTTVLAKLKIMEGGTNIILAMIVLFTAGKAMEATFKLHSRFAKGGSPFTPTGHTE